MYPFSAPLHRIYSSLNQRKSIHQDIIKDDWSHFMIGSRKLQTKTFTQFLELVPKMWYMFIIISFFLIIE